MTRDQALLAYIVFAQDQAVDLLLETVARKLESKGARVAGLIQRAAGTDEGCCGAVDVEDIVSGERWQIMQPLGKFARGCRLDPQAMAHVSVRQLDQVAQKPDILVLNRFGKGESEGAGLRAVFEAAMVAGVPVLTSVKDTYRDLWNQFSCDLAVELPAGEAAVMAWCLARIDLAAAGHAA